MIKKIYVLSWLSVTGALGEDTLTHQQWLDEIRPCITGLFHRLPYSENDWKGISGKHYFTTLQKDSSESGANVPLVIHPPAEKTLIIFYQNRVYSSSPLPPQILSLENRRYSEGFSTAPDDDLPIRQRDGAWVIYISGFDAPLRVSYQISSDRTRDSSPSGVSTRVRMDSEGLTHEPASPYEKNVFLKMTEITDSGTIAKFRSSVVQIIRAQFDFFQTNYHQRWERHRNTRLYEPCPDPVPFADALSSCMSFAVCADHRAFLDSMTKSSAFFKKATRCPPGVPYHPKPLGELVNLLPPPPKNVKPWRQGIHPAPLSFPATDTATNNSKPASPSSTKKKKTPPPPSAPTNTDSAGSGKESNPPKS